MAAAHGSMVGRSPGVVVARTSIEPATGDEIVRCILGGACSERVRCSDSSDGRALSRAAESMYRPTVTTASRNFGPELAYVPRNNISTCQPGCFV